jgi:signal transduction histidine kinase
MVGDMPDPELFRAVIASLMLDARSRRGSRADAGVRAYGEMVDLLWRKGNARAAIRLEELWNDAGQEHAFTLLCAYVMESFHREADREAFLEVCNNHSHVLPTERFTRIDDADARLREIGILQQRARALESEIEHRKALEAALRDALHEKEAIEEDLRAVVTREKDARTKAEASDAFKEVFLAILGHDLRNPLNTVLTTSRLMSMREEAQPDERTKLDRIITSGVRMQRMIDQLLDVTSARLANGIAVEPRTVDVVQLVAGIVDETRAADPPASIVFASAGPCLADVDADRFEQVVSNHLANALTHGDRSRPVHVTVERRGGMVVVSVHNHGPPIDLKLLPLLFDPFKGGDKPHGRPAGLGLGLYISERIVHAHGGRIDVHSSADAGTRFEAIFPGHE